jgi:hypothetical protein
VERIEGFEPEKMEFVPEIKKSAINLLDYRFLCIVGPCYVTCEPDFMLPRPLLCYLRAYLTISRVIYVMSHATSQKIRYHGFYPLSISF